MHEHGSWYKSFFLCMPKFVCACVLKYNMHDVFLTVDLQHGWDLCLAYTVLRCAGILPFILRFHAEQTEAVAVADFKPGNEEKEIMKDLTEKHGKKKWAY